MPSVRPLLPALALFAAACAGRVEPGAPPPTSGVPASLASTSHEELVARGAELYALHCAVCHGEEGRGNGEAAAYLFPPARDFTQGRFKLVSSTNGAPYDADLVATLRRGMPGSAMPAWNWLTEEDAWGLAAHVRELAIEGSAQRRADQAYEQGEQLSLSEARTWAAGRLTPAAPVAVPAAALVDAGVLARGAELYEQNCASCHAADGSGEPEPRWDENGTLNWARDFTAGYMKGGAGRDALVCRVRAGMPGTSMPPTDFSDAEVNAVVAHVRSLIPEGAEEALVQRRETLRVYRIAGSVPEDLDDARWEASDEIEVELAPLWWRKESVLRVSLTALHDGERIAVRVRWSDATGESQLFTDVQRVDAVALQFSGADAPPLFGMGSAWHRTSIWHWQSLRLLDVAGAVDLVDPTPHLRPDQDLGEVRADAPVYQRLQGVPPVSGHVDHVEGAGVEAVRRGAERRPADVQALPRWRDGAWEVLFVRTLEAPGPGAIPLAPGSRVQVACAVWNGAAGDQGAQKSISIWQELAVDP